MFGLNVSILKWIIIAVVIFVLLSFVNNKMLSNLDEKENFENEKAEKFSEITLKLEEAADKITKAVDTFANKKSKKAKKPKKEEYEDEEDEMEDDMEDEMEDEEDYEEKPKKKNGKKNGKKSLVEKYANYSGVSSSFGGDYLLL